MMSVKVIVIKIIEKGITTNTISQLRTALMKNSKSLSSS